MSFEYANAVTSGEYLLDVSSGKFRKGRRPFQPCNHIRVTVSPGRKPPYIEDGWFSEPTIHVFDGTGWTWQPNHWTQFPENTVGALDDVAVPSNVAGRAVRQLFDSALNVIPESVSIANFLWELREIKQLIPKLKSLVTAPGQLFLWWKFGAQPLIDDIKKMLNLVANVEDRLDHLRKINNRTVTIRHHASWNEDLYGNTIRVWDDGTHGPIGPTSVVQLPVWVSGKLHLSCQVRTALNLNGADVFLRAMVNALGLNNPAKIIWNAIPYSWLVDWFVDLDAFLDGLAIPMFEGTIDVVGASHTVETKEMYGAYGYTGPSELGHMPYPWMYSAEAECFGNTLIRGFRRRSGMPPGEVSFEGLSLTQQAILAALLQQQGVSRNRTRL